MGRKRKTPIANETLSQETLEVQETLLKDLENKDTCVETKVETSTSISEKTASDIVSKTKKTVFEVKKPSPAKEELKVGDKVKINKDVETDTLGRRIHNGIRNYTYNVLAIRPDGFISIECLTYAFLVRKDQVNKI